jgi:hypothetical protein
MLVKFVTDYRGRLTAERFFRDGEVADFPAEIANQLMRAGRAVGVGEVSSPDQGIEPSADETNLSRLTYRKLQQLAKRKNIPANQSRDALIEALR